MEVIGLIAEYNPMHNGHIYQINKIKEMYPDSIIILILNGYFLERGEISLVSKYDKTLLALNNKIDLVIELPFIYGSQAADIFANASIKILDSLHATKLVFGSESNNLELLNKIAAIQLYDPDYQELIKKYLDKGINYPTALAKALNIKEDFNKPNDLLAISYIKAIKNNNSNIEPISIKRTNDYHDLNSNEDIISASNIRNKISNKEDISKYLPKDNLKYIKSINKELLFNLLKYKVLTTNNLNCYLTVDEGIENRIVSMINSSDNIDELINKIKTKRYTYNKINRMLIHILIGLTKEDNINSSIDYIKVLGFNNHGRKYLNHIKKESEIPITINNDSIVYQYELKASLIYDLLTNSNTYHEELSNKPIRKEV